MNNLPFENFWLASHLPVDDVSIELSGNCRVEQGKLVCKRDSDVIGVPMKDDEGNSDPDGGRSCHPAAMFTTSEWELEFYYREKFWSGLTVSYRLAGEKYFTKFDLEPDQFGGQPPAWLRQDQEDE